VSALGRALVDMLLVSPVINTRSLTVAVNLVRTEIRWQDAISVPIVPPRQTSPDGA